MRVEPCRRKAWRAGPAWGRGGRGYDWPALEPPLPAAGSLGGASELGGAPPVYHALSLHTILLALEMSVG